MNLAFWNQLYFVLLMKSHLESYPCPLIKSEIRGDMILRQAVNGVSMRTLTHCNRL